jgi:hypothetical protein
MNLLWYALLLAPAVTTIECLLNKQKRIPYPVWFAFTGILLSYGAVLLVWKLVWYPLTIVWALNWPCCQIGKVEGTWTTVAGWMYRHELMLMAFACIAISLWVKWRLAPEWCRDGREKD